MQIEKKNLTDLNPATYNPRVELQTGDADYEKLKTSIETFGHVQLIVWNKKTGNVVGGHQTLTVLKDLGYTEADCVVVDLSNAEEKALNVALNKISGRWDIEKLGQVMEELVAEGMAMYTGYETKEIEKITNEVERTISEVGEIDVNAFAEDVFSHKCPRCGFLY